MIGEANTAGAWPHIAAHYVSEARYAGRVLDRQPDAHRALLRGTADVEARHWVYAVEAVLRWVNAS